MTPVNQTIVESGKGNCMQAAIASLINLSLEEVPNFITYGIDWFPRLVDFLDAYQCVCYGSGYPDGSTRLDTRHVDGYVFAGVKSRTIVDKNHAVLVNVHTGIIEHDPNPNKLWEGEKAEGNILYWLLIERSVTK